MTAHDPQFPRSHLDNMQPRSRQNIAPIWGWIFAYVILLGAAGVVLSVWGLMHLAYAVGMWMAENFDCVNCGGW